MDRNKEQQKQPVQEQGAGRLVTDDDSPTEVRDISNIDRQEGDMDNGELGGNFRQENAGEPSER